jgi:hypothetical protein
MNTIDVKNGSPVAHISEAGRSLTIIENVTPNFILTQEGLFHRDTGLPANEKSKGKLSIDLADVGPLRRELENETGEQLISADNAAVAKAIEKRKQSRAMAE